VPPKKRKREAALEHAHAKWLAAELKRKRDAGGAPADDADVGFEHGIVGDGSRIVEHDVDPSLAHSSGQSYNKPS
jgi:hypothetical protein